MNNGLGLEDLLGKKLGIELVCNLRGIEMTENRTSINLHCVKCGKYKSKKSKSKLCTACLFGKDFKKSFIRV